MNLQSPKRQGTSRLAERLFDEQEEFCYIHVISYFYYSNGVASAPNCVAPIDVSEMPLLTSAAIS